MKKSTLILLGVIIVIVVVGIVLFGGERSQYNYVEGDVDATSFEDRLPGGFDLELPIDYGQLSQSQKAIRKETGRELFKITYQTPDQIDGAMQQMRLALEQEDFSILTQEREVTKGVLSAQRDDSQITMTFDRDERRTTVDIAYLK